MMTPAPYNIRYANIAAKRVVEPTDNKVLPTSFPKFIPNVAASAPMLSTNSMTLKGYVRSIEKSFIKKKPANAPLTNLNTLFTYVGNRVIKAVPTSVIVPRNTSPEIPVKFFLIGWKERYMFQGVADKYSFCILPTS